MENYKPRPFSETLLITFCLAMVITIIIIGVMSYLGAWQILIVPK